jgi:hypothetical protein
MLNRQEICVIGNKGIDSVENLKGKRIRIAERAGISRRFITILLIQQGLDPEEDVTFVPAGIPSLKAARPDLEKGDFGAAIVVQSEVPQAAKEGYALLGRMTDVYPEGYVHRCVVTTGDFLERHPDTIKRFLRAMIRSYRFVANEKNYGEIMKFCWRYPWEKDMGWDTIDREEIESEQAAYFRGLPEDGGIPKKALEVMIEEEKWAGKLPDSYTVDKVLRLELVEEALKEVNAKYGPNGY